MDLTILGVLNKSSSYKNSSIFNSSELLLSADFLFYHVHMSALRSTDMYLRIQIPIILSIERFLRIRDKDLKLLISI